MATSTEQINQLIGGFTDLKAFFETHRASLEADAAAVLSQLSEISRTFYVDQALGSDDNIGTIEAPLASITKAAQLTPRGGQLTVILRGDYTTTGREVLEQQYVRLTYQGGGTRANLHFAPVASDDPTTIGDISSMIGASFIQADLIHFHLPVSDPGTSYTGLFRNRGRTAFRFSNCEFTVEAGADTALIRNEIASDLYLENTNGGLSHMAGHFVQGVAAGTDPALVYHVRSTNQATL